MFGYSEEIGQFWPKLEKKTKKLHLIIKQKMTKRYVTCFFVVVPATGSIMNRFTVWLVAAVDRLSVSEVCDACVRACVRTCAHLCVHMYVRVHVCGCVRFCECVYT